MKRLMRLLSLLSFFGGPIAQDLWSSLGTMKKWVASVAEPPESYGPLVPTIVFQTSDSST
jgi:hypothetical protein